MAVYQELKLEQLSQSVVTNSSKVRIFWTSTQTDASWNYVSDFAYIYYSINGEAEVKESARYKLPEKATVTIMDLTIEVPHNTNGEATLKVRTWANTHISAGIVQLEQTLVLDPIAPTTIVATDGFIGEASTLKLTKHNNLYVNTIKFTFGSQSGYISGDGSISAEPVMLNANEISFALPESFYEEIPNDSSGVCQLICTTYMDDAQVGQATESSFNVLTDEQTCGPQVAGAVFDSNEATLSLTEDNHIFIRYHSNAQCIITPVASKAATIVKKWINGVEVTGDTLVIPQIAQDNVIFKVQDSRGYEATFVQPLQLKKYTSVTNNAQLSRDDPTSGKATLTFSGNWFNDSLGSASNVLMLQYKIDSGEYVTVETVTFDGNSYKAIVNLTELDYRKVFEFTARAADKLGESIKRLTLKKGIPVFDWGEDDFAFHVPVQIDGNLNVNGALTVNGMEFSADGSGASIDDSTISSGATWSSEKISSELGKLDIFVRDDSQWSAVTILPDAAVSWTGLGYYWTANATHTSTEYTGTYNSTQELIPVYPNTTYELSNFRGVYFLYDSNRKNGERSAIHNDLSSPVTFTTGSSHHYIGISHQPTSTHTVEKISLVQTTISEKEYNALPTRAESLKALYGKTVVCFGDSLFGMYRGEDSAPAFIAVETGATVYNVGFGGCRMAVHPTSGYAAFSMWALAKAIIENDWTDQETQAANGSSYFPEQLRLLKSIDFNNVDICVIHYGTNDFASGNGIQIDNTSNFLDCNTMCGALRYSIEKLLGAYPKLKLYISLPVYRYWTNDDGSITYAETYLNKNGKTLLEFVEAMRNTAREYNLPIIDGFYDLGINKINASTFLPDGTHHNSVGRERFGRFIGARLSP